MKFENSKLNIRDFSEMQLSSTLLAALSKMSIFKPTSVQSQAIPVGVAGSDLVAIAQTGSGKTLAYALSVLTRLEQAPEARALVLAPSREMALQIHKVFLELCHELPITACLAIGGTTGSKQINQLKKMPRLIVATPGRMNDHLTNNKLLLQNVEIVVLDEADRMLDMGFAPQLKKIQATMRGNWQTLMFSASFGPAVEKIASAFMRETAVMVRDAQAEEPVGTLSQTILLIDRDKKEDRLLDELNATKGSVIVFTGNQESCESVGKFLESYGYESDYIHGGLSQGQRNRVVRSFREGGLRIIVATDLLARGLDVPQVAHVFNYDLPFQAEDFLHRIGRTARAGRAGHALTFVSPSDFRMYEKIQPYLQGAKEIKVSANFEFTTRRPRTDRFEHKKSAGSMRTSQSKLSNGPRAETHTKTPHRAHKPNAGPSFGPHSARSTSTQGSNTTNAYQDKRGSSGGSAQKYSGTKASGTKYATPKSGQSAGKRPGPKSGTATKAKSRFR